MRLAGIAGMMRCLLRRSAAALTVALCLLASLGSAHAASTTPQRRSEAEYRDHLNSLATLIEQCRQRMDVSNCNGDAVGPDEIVTASTRADPRRVSFGWLRGLLDLIGSHKISPADAVPLLQAATRRVQLEQSEAPGHTASAKSAVTSRAAEHTALTAILDRAEFRQADPSLTQRVLEVVAIWINRWLAGLAEYSAHRRWLGLLLEWGFVVLACAALAYWFMRQMRRARGLRVEQASHAESAPAMRNWERLHQEAEQAARQQRWRDAVRGYYWATIARLESRGQWPADQARTPREYLRLILSGHPKHDDLRLLTRRFEACWYGSDTATQLDCDTARQLFERLVAR